MTKEKIISLEAYKKKLKDRLASPVPSKWAKRGSDGYKAFLTRELRLVSNTLIDAELESPKDKK